MKRLILVLSFLLVLVPLTAAAQWTEGKRFNIYFPAEFAGIAATDKPTVPEDWKTRFVPPSDNGMDLRNIPFSFSLGAEISPVLSQKQKSWRISLPISYRIVSFHFGHIYLLKDGAAVTTVDWWDRVAVADVVAKHYSPRIGVELAKGRNSYAVSLQHYRLVEQQYVGKDCHGCPNTSSVFASRDLGSGVSPRFDYFRMLDDRDGPLNCLGFFFEATGTRHFRFGFSVK
jgi:hypothetical protein